MQRARSEAHHRRGNTASVAQYPSNTTTAVMASVGIDLPPQAASAGISSSAANTRVGSCAWDIVRQT